MILGRVVGSVWGGKEVSSLEHSKLVQVQPVVLSGNGETLMVRADGDPPCLSRCVIIALDQLGAGVGEYVLVAHGSRVRDLTVGPSKPTKEVVVAIVDECEVDLNLHRLEDS